MTYSLRPYAPLKCTHLLNASLLLVIYKSLYQTNKELRNISNDLNIDQTKQGILSNVTSYEHPVCMQNVVDIFAAVAMSCEY